MMQMKFPQAPLQYGWLAVLVGVAILERSLSPLLILPVAWQQRRDDLALGARVTAIATEVAERYLVMTQVQEQVEILQADSTRSLRSMQAIESKLDKHQTKIGKQQHRIETQTTNHNVMVSKIACQADRNRQLEAQMQALWEIVQPAPAKVVKMQQQTLLTIDSANFDHAARQLNIKIDYSKLKRFIHQNFGSLEARLFVGKDPKRDRQNLWFQHLRDCGYRVKTKPVVNGKANVDVELTMDLRDDGFEFKKVVLCSGDGDYVSVVQWLQQQGVQVIVLNLPEQTSPRLRQVADRYINLREIQDEIKQSQTA